LPINVLEKLMQSDDLFETVDTRHGRVTLFANDTGALSESLRLYGEWAHNELSFMLSMVKPGDTVVDVGGYIGTHTLAFARHVGESGQVFAIEAQARSFELLTRNVKENGLTNVRAENAIASAVAKEEHIPSIDIETPASYGSASLRDVFIQTPGHHKPEEISEVTVKSIAIDNLPLASCALLKIDVEGMEDLVLRGAGEVIRRHGPAIYAECNSLEDGLRCLSLLKGYGYRVRAHVVLAFNEDNFRHCSQNIFMGAREVALVGTPETSDFLEGYESRPCELLLDIETADDLALALLNKPQYEHEVLRAGAAARSGGRVVLDEAVASRERARQASEKEEQYAHELIDLKGQLARELQELKDRSAHELQNLKNQLAHELQDLKTLSAHEQEELKAQSARALEQRERKIASAEEEAARLRGEVELATAGTARAVEAERMAREAELKLQATVDEIMRSTSWRITAPLRALGKKS
jgi:FkbM family methyltransferase